MFHKDLPKFLRELAENNNKEWFTKNKTRYQQNVQEPTLEFIRAMQPRLSKISKHLVADDSKSGGSMFRIYRDVRFSKDKRPYKENVAIRFMHEDGGPGYYLGIDNAGVTAGMGIWHPESPTLKKIREAIVKDTKGWKKARDDKATQKDWEYSGESLKRPPKGFDAEHECIEDLKRKDFVGFSKFKKPDLLKDDFADKLVARYKTGVPYMRFLCKALGLKF